jgi:hypothetical protein
LTVRHKQFLPPMAPPPRIDPGERFVIAGRTGSGKSTLASWFLAGSSQHWVILNPKHTPFYRQLPDSIVYRKFKPWDLLSDARRRKFVVLELSGEESQPYFMDGIIAWLHATLKNIGVCCDELYTLHASSGRAGPGLVGWLTRGREYKQSFLGLTQRPVWVSRFVFSEASYLIEMDLTFEDDRETLYEYTGSPYFRARVLGHRWLCYNVSLDATTLYGPVPPPLLNRSLRHG